MSVSLIAACATPVMHQVCALLDDDHAGLAAAGAGHAVVGTGVAAFAELGLSDSVAAARTGRAIRTAPAGPAEVIAVVALLEGLIQVAIAAVRPKG